MHPQTQNKRLISIVIPCYNEEKLLSNTIDSIVENIIDLNYNFEFILVDDGSIDATQLIIKQLSEGNKYNPYLIKGIILSRNFGHQNAIGAGLSYATGDAVIMMDADLEHPSSIIPKLISIWEEGYDVAYTVREDSKNTGVIKRITSRYFYKLYNLLSGWNIEQGTADFRLVDAKIAKILATMVEQAKFYRGLVKWTGFKQKAVRYSPNIQLSRSSRYSYSKMIKLALIALVSFSSRPLYLSVLFGSLVLLFSLIYAAYVMVVYFMGNTVPGQPSILITVTFLSGAIMILQGIQSIYIATIYNEVKSRPHFVVKETTGV